MKGGFLISPKGRELLLKENKLSPPFATDPETLGNISSTMMDYILKNSKITILSAGSLYGYIYMAVLKSDVKSPLNVHSLTKCACANPNDLSCDPNSDACMEEANVFAFKLTFLSVQDEVSFSDSVNRKRTNLTSDFLSECRMQYSLYNQHLLAGEALIPPTLSPKPAIIPLASAEADKYIKTIEPKNGLLFLAKKNSQASGAKYLGVMFMKFATRYQTLGSYIKSDTHTPAEKTHFNNVGRFALVYLAMKYGIVHQDAHQENILISKEEGFFVDSAGKPVAGKALIIDLGRVRKISPELMTMTFSWENASRVLGFLQDSSSGEDNTIWWSYRWLTYYDVEYRKRDIKAKIKEDLKKVNINNRLGMGADMVDALADRRVKEHLEKYVPKPNNTELEINNAIKILYYQFRLRLKAITPRFAEHGLKGDPVDMSVTEYETELHGLHPTEVVAVKPPAFGPSFALAASNVLNALRKIAVPKEEKSVDAESLLLPPLDAEARGVPPKLQRAVATRNISLSL